jgi:transcriptional regulator with XRE-family HTH domain
MGRLYDLIQEHIDAQAPYKPSVSKVAEQLGVSDQTVHNWEHPKGMIGKAHLLAIAKLTRNPYSVVRDAWLEDVGLLRPGPGEPPAAETG